MKIKKELIKREIAGETILVPVGKTVYDSNGLFVLNELGTFIWDILPDAETVTEIVSAVTEAYEVTSAEAEEDINQFLEKLKSLDIL